MPNSLLFNYLLNIQEQIYDLNSQQKLRAEKFKIMDIVFIRSTVKHNTGTLERYQFGEVLLITGKNNPMRRLQSSDLTNLASYAFTENEKYLDNPKNRKLITRSVIDKSSMWNFGGTYIPLARRLYMLSEALLEARWSEYEELSQKSETKRGGFYKKNNKSLENFVAQESIMLRKKIRIFINNSPAFYGNFGNELQQISRVINTELEPVRFAQVLQRLKLLVEGYNIHNFAYKKRSFAIYGKAKEDFLTYINRVIKRIRDSL